MQSRAVQSSPVQSCLSRLPNECARLLLVGRLHAACTEKKQRDVVSRISAASHHDAEGFGGLDSARLVGRIAPGKLQYKLQAGTHWPAFTRDGGHADLMQPCRPIHEADRGNSAKGHRVEANLGEMLRCRRRPRRQEWETRIAGLYRAAGTHVDGLAMR